MKHFILGTAGHVDHGKTMLVKALTGKDTDRLKEEKKRGISIELGFAPFQLESGNMASIIDVPGHERFIKNMLAGVGGIDLVLFVIAADEGIMPQTREHMDIVHLLNIEQGIVIITKSDLVDEEWLQLMHEEVKEFLKGTVLANSPVVDISVVSGQGIESLKKLIDQMTQEIKTKEFIGRTRLPIDRIFSITGFGTVATGTLMAGQIRVGDSLEILPESIESRVRSIQVHGSKVDTAVAGQRVAINLTGIEVNEINRGSVLVAPNTLQASYRVDAELNLLSNAEKALANRARIRFHLGTKEVLGRVVLLEGNELKPGERAFVQFELEELIVAGKNDRFVIRSYSPLITIGGGVVIDPSPQKHKRFYDKVIEALRTKQKGTPGEVLHQYMEGAAKVILTIKELEKGMELAPEVMLEALNELVKEEQVKIVKMENVQYIIPLSIYNRIINQLKEILTKYHKEYSLRIGYPKEEIRSRLFPGVQSKLYNVLINVMEADEIIRVSDKYISLFNFSPEPDQAQLKKLLSIEEKYISTAFQPLGWQDIANELKLTKEESDEILIYLQEKQRLIKISDDFYLHQKVLTDGVVKIKNQLEEKGETTLGEIRDTLNTSRKYALPLLEYLDREKITRRVGDKRVLY